MKVEKFLLMHPFPHDSPAAILADDIATFYKEKTKGTTRPKLGPHITLLPPFYAPRDEMIHLSKGLDMMKALYRDLKHSLMEARISEIGFFNNPNNGVLILKIKLPSHYQAVVEDYKKGLSHFATWVFPPDDLSFNPHLCIFEGETVYRDLQKLVKEFPRSKIEGVSFNLPTPTIMRKVEEGDKARWEEFGRSG